MSRKSNIILFQKQRRVIPEITFYQEKNAGTLKLSLHPVFLDPGWGDWKRCKEHNRLLTFTDVCIQAFYLCSSNPEHEVTCHFPGKWIWTTSCLWLVWESSASDLNVTGSFLEHTPEISTHLRIFKSFKTWITHKSVLYVFLTVI